MSVQFVKLLIVQSLLTVVDKLNREFQRFAISNKACQQLDIGMVPIIMVHQGIFTSQGFHISKLKKTHVLPLVKNDVVGMDMTLSFLLIVQHCWVIQQKGGQEGT